EGQFFSAGTRSRTPATSAATSFSATSTPVTDAHVMPSSTQTRPSSNLLTDDPSAIGVKRSGTSAYSRSSPVVTLGDEFVGDRQCVIQDLERFLELVARDRQRRAAHNDVPV